jgi:hypothetical protein
MKPISKQEVPEFLRKWKGDRTVLAAAKDLGVSPQTFHLWLRGDGLPGDENLAKIGYRWAVVPENVK